LRTEIMDSLAALSFMFGANDISMSPKDGVTV
jgi:hypothetical protein